MDHGDQQAGHEPWRRIPRKSQSAPHNAPTATAASQVEPATLRIPSATADPSSPLPSQPNDPAGSEPKELVESNSIPKIACHKDKQALALRILKEEFVELVVMSASFGYTYAGGEVIFAVPSAELEKLFEPSTYSPNIVERLKNTVSIDLFRTWKTFSSSIDAMLSEDSIPTETQAVIRNNFDGEENRTFVQNYLQRLVRLKTRTRSLVPWMQSRFLSPLE